MEPIYNEIGVDYSNLRKPDPRIGAYIWQALGSARSVLNVGAGTGSYEPTDRDVTALEPSDEMLGQRSASAAPAVKGSAENIPFDDKTFDATMAVLTVHHWSDQAKGMAEMRRVTKGPVVILTFDPRHGNFWLDDYLPQRAALDDKQMPLMSDYKKWLGPIDVQTVPIPHDCSDGFLGAYWRRPTAYLDEVIRGGISCFWMMDDVPQALDQLARDLEDGTWEERYGHLHDQETLDLGYRLVVSAE